VAHFRARNARNLPKLAPHAHGPRKFSDNTDKADKNKPERQQASGQTKARQNEDKPDKRRGRKKH